MIMTARRTTPLARSARTRHGKPTPGPEALARRNSEWRQLKDRGGMDDGKPWTYKRLAAFVGVTEVTVKRGVKSARLDLKLGPTNRERLTAIVGGRDGEYYAQLVERGKDPAARAWLAERHPDPR